MQLVSVVQVSRSSEIPYCMDVKNELPPFFFFQAEVFTVAATLTADRLCWATEDS